jgi:hypothetical protein
MIQIIPVYHTQAPGFTMEKGLVFLSFCGDTSNFCPNSYK